MDILLFVSLQFINSPVESKYIVDFCLPTYKSNLAFLCSRFLAQSKYIAKGQLISKKQIGEP